MPLNHAPKPQNPHLMPGLSILHLNSSTHTPAQSCPSVSHTKSCTQIRSRNILYKYENARIKPIKKCTKRRSGSGGRTRKRRRRREESSLKPHTVHPLLCPVPIPWFPCLIHWTALASSAPLASGTAPDSYTHHPPCWVLTPTSLGQVLLISRTLSHSSTSERPCRGSSAFSQLHFGQQASPSALWVHSMSIVQTSASLAAATNRHQRRAGLPVWIGNYSLKECSKEEVVSAWGCSSMAKWLPSVHKALGLMLSTAQKIKQNRITSATFGLFTWLCLAI
jgi:hypothetical protein